MLGGDSGFFESSSFVAVGPVERIDHRTVVVLGQTYVIDKATQVTSQIDLGSYVAVAGSVATVSAVTATRVQVLPSLYVDGSSLTYVRGQVRTLSESVGRLSVGALQIDYTPSLGTTDKVVLAVGDIANFSGIKPSPSGAMLAFSTKGVTNKKSIIGGDVQGKSIIGGDLQGKSIIGGDAS